MEAYRVGALADLISSSKASKGLGEEGTGKVKKPLQSLFTSKIPKETEPVLVSGTENGSAKKKKSKKRSSAEASGDDVDVDTSVVVTGATEASPKKKAVVKAADSDDDEDAPQYTQPSLRYKVSQVLQLHQRTTDTPR